MVKISEEMRKIVKEQGFLSNNDGEHFSCRVITENGSLSSKQLKNISEIAEKFGCGKISLTTRLTLEIPGIKYEDIENVKKHLKKDNLVSGGTGPKVRPIVSCKGTVCTYGLCDTQRIGTRLHEIFYKGWHHVKLPHKFKIGIGGCPNNCIKPSLNDFGIVGQLVLAYDEDLCLGCRKCGPLAVCKMNALKMIDKKLSIDKEKCKNCGRCIGKCNFDALKEGQRGFKIYIGGKWGKLSRTGNLLKGIYNEDEIIKIIEKTLLLYREQGKTGERFGDMIDRIGLKEIETQILEDEILNRKDEILDEDFNILSETTC